MAGFTKSGSRDNFNFKSSAFLPYAILLCFFIFFLHSYVIKLPNKQFHVCMFM